MEFHIYDAPHHLCNPACFSRSLFTGKERDAESGNGYFGARYYASSMGRFLSPDPTFQSALSADPQTWNRYTYALNNPLAIIDPNGEMWQLSSAGTWDWMDKCNQGTTCVTQIAQQEGNNVVVYGPSSADDKQSFAANKQRYVNVSDIAATDGAYFELKSDAHSYASPQTAVDLYNGAFDYHLTYPNDSKLFVTDIGKSDGSNFSPHKTHNIGRSVDFRYMDAQGRPIASDRKLAAIWYADDSRMETMVNIFKENGFNQNYSDNDGVYGTSWAPGHDTHIHFGKTSHLGQCEIGPCK
jgi:RHS repeat-associated protein